MDIDQDKKYFLSQLKNNPIFLLNHIKSLSSIFIEKYRNKYFVTPTDIHRNNKKKPRWLSKIKTKNNSYCRDSTTLMQRIPQRKLTALTLRKNAIPEIPIQSNDFEDYLATHRWGLLIDDLFEHTKHETPWQLPDAVTEALTKPSNKQDPAWETYSVCERVCNLLTWISFIPKDMRATILPKSIHAYLEDCMQWILTHIEYYGKKTNNHIINNARCLIMSGTVLMNEKAVIVGIEILQHLLNQLVQPKGSLRERSNHYQLLIATWLLDIQFFLKSCEYFDNPIVTTLDDIIKKMLSIAAMTCDHQGYMHVFIGDISPDLSPEKTVKRLLLCYPSVWPIRPIEITSEDDWWIIRNTANKIILNCPEGKYPLSYPTHSHNDITSFVWLYQETPILVDSGRARYTKDPVSLRQKSAAGHSIPLINGYPPLCESLIANGNWHPTPYSTADVKVSVNPNQSIMLLHNGFKRATPVHTHERKITLNDHSIEVSDDFHGADSVEIYFYWHFHSCFATFDPSQCLIKSNDHYVLILLDNKDAIQNVRFEKSQQHSSQYGFASLCPVIVIDYKVQLPIKITTQFKVKSCVELPVF